MLLRKKERVNKKKRVIMKVSCVVRKKIDDDDDDDEMRGRERSIRMMVWSMRSKAIQSSNQILQNHFFKKQNC